MQVKPDRQDGRNHGGYVEKTNVNSIMNGVYLKLVCVVSMGCGKEISFSEHIYTAL